MATILVVDDSASMRRMVTLVLEDAGFSVLESHDGADALAKAQAETVDAVLTDVNMPVMDGIELVRALRELPAYKFTPMIMLTTVTSSDKKSDGKAAGATGWIIKPFSPAQLLNIIQRILS